MKKNSQKLKLTIVLFLALATHFIKAQNCNASFTYSIGANGNTTFSATAVPSPTSYFSWNFGNGSSGSFTNVNTAATTYTSNGYYIANLGFQNAPFSCSMFTSQLIYVNTTTINPTCPSVNASFVSSPGSNGSVTFVSTSTGSVSGALFVWNMGDGTTIYSYSVIPLSHNYTANATYIATLTVLVGNAPACGYSATAPIVVNTTSNTLCNLNAGFTSSILAAGAVQFSNTSAGTSSNVVYSWSYGDGSPISNSASPAHTYTANGNYTVTLIANNNYTPTCISTITSVVNVSSVCNLNPDFTFTTTSNGGVTFSNTSTGTTTNTNYQWSFGDGNTSSTAAPSYSYANSGTYTVTLQANASTNTLFPCVASKSHSVVVTNTCIANANFSLVPSGTPQYWYALVSNTANIASAEWSWGDGSPNGLGMVNSHTYAAAGTYSICLSVTLTCGATGTYCNSQYISKTTGSATDIVYVNCLTEEMLLTGIKNNSQDTISITLSPNPNNGNFNVNMGGLNSSLVKVQVYNVIGKVIFETESEIYNGKLVKNIQLENSANGVYFINIIANSNNYMRKIIINK